MIKFFAKRKYRKGFTLTETIVVVALIAIIIACVVAFGTPVRGIVKNANARDDALTINKIIGDYIERQLSFANCMDIYIGYDYDSSDTSLSDTFDTYVGYGKDTEKTNRPGMMVLKFYPDGIDSTFRVLDYQIRADAVSGTWPTFSSVDIVTNDSYQVFNEDFYGGLQHFMTAYVPDTTVAGVTIETNAANKAYLTFGIDAFSIADTGAIEAEESVSGSNDGIKGYYTETLSFNSGKEIEKKTTEFEKKHIMEKVASEKVSFAVENLKGKTYTKAIHQNPADETSPIVKYQMETESPNLTVHRNNAGTDVIIFYNIRQYDY